MWDTFLISQSESTKWRNIEGVLLSEFNPIIVQDHGIGSVDVNVWRVYKDNV